MNNLQSWGISYNPKEYEATVENYSTVSNTPSPGAPIPWPPSFPGPSGTFPDGDTCKDKFCAHNPSTNCKIDVVNNKFSATDNSTKQILLTYV